MRLLPVTFALAFALDAHARGTADPSDSPEADPAVDDASAGEPPKKSDDGRSWMVLPGAFYGQETSVGFALFGSVTFPIRGTGPGTWNSTISSALVVTLKKQVSLAVWPTLYFGTENAWVVNGSYIGSHFPNRYYGVGPDSDAVFQDYTRRWVLTETTLMRRVVPGVYLGAVDNFSVFDVRDPGEPVRGNDKTPADWEGDDALGGDGVVGEDGGVVHGLGLRARYEGRDNDQSARTGVYADARFVGYSGLIGSDYGYTETVVDLRGYYTFGPDFTLAGQWFTEVRTGAVPFTHMSELGGDNVLRGMFEGRFRDASLTAVQAELRYPIYWRFRGAAFGGAGQVLHDPKGAVRPRWTAGGGLRFELDESSHSVIRLDVAGGPDGAGFILQFGEAF